MNTKKRVMIYFFSGFLIMGLAFPIGYALGLEIVGDFLGVIRESGVAIGAKKLTDSHLRWQQIAGTNAQQFGDGNSDPFAQLDAKVTPDGRVMFELISFPAGRPVGIVLNDRVNASYSLTSDNGQLIIRDEQQGDDHIVAIIQDSGIIFPLAGPACFPGPCS